MVSQAALPLNTASRAGLPTVGHQDAIAVGLGSVSAADPGFITRFDPDSGRIQKLISIDYTPQSSVDVGYEAVWAGTGLGVVRIDPATNEITATIPSSQTGTARGLTSTAVAVGETAVWVANTFVPGSVFKTSRKRGSVSRIDPQTNVVVTTIPVGHEPFAIAAGYGAVWVTNRTDGTLSRIDPSTRSPTTAKSTDSLRFGGCSPESAPCDTPICAAACLPRCPRPVVRNRRLAGTFGTSRAHSDPRRHADLAQPCESVVPVGPIALLSCSPRCSPRISSARTTRRPGVQQFDVSDGGTSRV